MSNWRMFYRSLRDHPGVHIGLAWPFMVLLAIVNREGAAELPVGRVALVTLAVGALPWIPILWTAWTGRHQYATDEPKDTP